MGLNWIIWIKSGGYLDFVSDVVIDWTCLAVWQVLHNLFFLKFMLNDFCNLDGKVNLTDDSLNRSLTFTMTFSRCYNNGACVFGNTYIGFWHCSETSHAWRYVLQGSAVVVVPAEAVVEEASEEVAEAVDEGEVAVDEGAELPVETGAGTAARADTSPGNAPSRSCVETARVKVTLRLTARRRVGPPPFSPSDLYIDCQSSLPCI